VLAFDGSYNRDSTALVFCSIAPRPHIEVVAAWERPRSDAGWRTPRDEVLSVIHDTMDRLDVVEFAPDPFGWTHEIEELEQRYGEVVVPFPTNNKSLMAPASSVFLEGAKDRAFTIDGTEILLRHLGNAVAKPHRIGTEEYALPVKASADSPDKIDVAIGAVVAYARARYHALHPPKPRLRFTAV
jgi:phage terminase large subunit-like protein